MSGNSRDKIPGDSGAKGEKGKVVGEYVQLYEKLKEDLGLGNVVLIILGAILLMFSPDQGWQFDIPGWDYTLAYRGWLGILCFVISLIKMCFKNRKSGDKSPNQKGDLASITSPTPQPEKTAPVPAPKAEQPSVWPIKSMYVHFPSSQIGALAQMTHQLSNCRDYAAAMLLLVFFQQEFRGRLYSSPVPQPFAVEKAGEISSVKGNGDNRWCWWRWEGGDEGFQLLVSLCQQGRRIRRRDKEESDGKEIC